MLWGACCIADWKNPFFFALKCSKTMKNMPKKIQVDVQFASRNRVRNTALRPAPIALNASDSPTVKSQIIRISFYFVLSSERKTRLNFTCRK